MSTKYKFRNQEALHFVSFAVVGWIDLFIRDEYRQILLDSWNYCMTKKGLEIYAWVIMTSHVHMIVGTHGDNLEDIFRDMKRHTSKQLRQAIVGNPKESRREWMIAYMKATGKKNKHNAGFQLWRQDNHPIELTNPEMTRQKLEYIHYNPVEAGLVDYPEEWKYSSARDYYDETRKGLLEIYKFDGL